MTTAEKHCTHLHARAVVVLAARVGLAPHLCEEAAVLAGLVLVALLLLRKLIQPACTQHQLTANEKTEYWRQIEPVLAKTFINWNTCTGLPWIWWRRQRRARQQLEYLRVN